MTFPKVSESQDPQAFNYMALNSQTRIVVQQRTSEIKTLMRRTAQDIIDIGEKLTEVKERLCHGLFGEWLKDEFNWGEWTAQKFMQVYRRFKNVNFTDLSIASSALYLLAAPSTPEEVRQEALERAFQGEVITYTLAKEIRFHHTIDVEAETVANEKEASDLNQATPEQEPLPQPETVCEPLPLTNEAEIKPRDISNTDPLPTPEQSQVSGELEDLAQAQIAPVTQFKVDDRICILRRQSGGKNAKIWQITPDGWLRVDVEGHKGVRFTLKPNWVERMPEETPEQHNELPEHVLSPGWTDEPDPETPAIADIPLQAQWEGEAHLQFQAGDRLQLTILGKSNRQWTGEVSDVVEVADNRIKVTVEISQSPNPVPTK